MKVDLYTKIVLTVIALALTFNLLKPVLLLNDVAAEEDKKFEHLQISISAVGIYFFDTKTGDLWIYKEQGDIAKYTLTNGIGSPFKRTRQ